MTNHPNRRKTRRFSLEASGSADTKRVIDARLGTTIVATIQQLSNGLWIVEDLYGRRNENFAPRVTAKTALAHIEKYPEFLAEILQPESPAEMIQRGPICLQID